MTDRPDDDGRDETGDGPDGERRAPSPWATPGAPLEEPAPPTPPPPGHGPPPAPPRYGPPPAPPGYGPPPAPPGYGPPPAPPGYGVAVLPKAGGVRTGPLPLHPMTVGDILDGAFKLLKANAATILTIVAVFVVPIQLVAAFVQRNVLGGATFVDTFRDPSLAEVTVDGGQTAGEAAVTAAAFLASILVLPFMAGAISQVVAASYLGTEITAWRALAITMRRWWALFASWVVVHVLEAAGFVVAFVAGIAVVAAGGGVAGLALLALMALGLGVPVLLVVMGLSVAVAPAIVVENLGPIQGVRRSWSLVRRRFFPILGIALLAGFVAFVVGQILSTVPTVPALFVDLRWGWVLLAVGGIFGSLVTEPIVAIVATLLYFDARIRTEGFDLQVIAAELAERAERSSRA